MVFLSIIFGTFEGSMCCSLGCWQILELGCYSSLCFSQWLYDSSLDSLYAYLCCLLKSRMPVECLISIHNNSAFYQVHKLGAFSPWEREVSFQRRCRLPWHQEVMFSSVFLQWKLNLYLLYWFHICLILMLVFHCLSAVTSLSPVVFMAKESAIFLCFLLWFLYESWMPVFSVFSTLLYE